MCLLISIHCSGLFCLITQVIYWNLRTVLFQYHRVVLAEAQIVWHAMCGCQQKVKHKTHSIASHSRKGMKFSNFEVPQPTELLLRWKNAPSFNCSMKFKNSTSCHIQVKETDPFNKSGTHCCMSQGSRVWAKALSMRLFSLGIVEVL